jgi:hypothetical protein
LIKAAVIGLILLGSLSLVGSTILASDFFAIVGFSLAFWGVILLYLIPTKNKFAFLSNAQIEIAYMNIERTLNENRTSQNGFYVPTNDSFFPDFVRKSSINKKVSQCIFVMTPSSQSKDSDSTISLNYEIKFIPPGLALCNLFEQQLGKSFSEISLANLETIFPSLLTKKLKVAKSVDIEILNEGVTFMITKSAFKKTCEKANGQPNMHKQVGCLLVSGIACALTQVTKTPVMVESEVNLQQDLTKIHYKFIRQLGYT